MKVLDIKKLSGNLLDIGFGEGTDLLFYKKNGFVAFDKHLFKLGDDDQTDIVMKL